MRWLQLQSETELLARLNTELSNRCYTSASSHPARKAPRSAIARSALKAPSCSGPTIIPKSRCTAIPLSNTRTASTQGTGPGVAELMLSSAEKLAKAGADFLIAPVNTVHQAFDLVEHRSPRPWLHIAVEVAKEAKHHGYKRLGVLGTRSLMDGPVYRETLKAAGIEQRVPGAEQRERIHRMIFDELVQGTFLPRTQAYFTEVIRGLKDEGCDAVALACTEIPLTDDTGILSAAHAGLHAHSRREPLCARR